MTPSEIITDEEINAHHFGRFGANADPREIVNEGVLKAAFGYSSGSTVCTILRRHALTTNGHALTRKGKNYLQAVFSDVPLAHVLGLTKEGQK